MKQCNLELENEAALVYRLYRERSLATQSALRATFRSLERIEGPKTLVFISEGLGTESPGEVRDLGIAASRARVTLFVLLLDTSSADASFDYSAIATMEDREAESAAITTSPRKRAGPCCASLVRARWPSSGSRAMMGYYMLGFEPEGNDRDGGNHPVKVEVSTGPRPRCAPADCSAFPSPHRRPRRSWHPRRSARLSWSPACRFALTAFALRDGASGRVRVLMPPGWPARADP